MRPPCSLRSQRLCHDLCRMTSLSPLLTFVRARSALLSQLASCDITAGITCVLVRVGALSASKRSSITSLLLRVRAAVSVPYLTLQLHLRGSSQRGVASVLAASVTVASVLAASRGPSQRGVALVLGASVTVAQGVRHTQGPGGSRGSNRRASNRHQPVSHGRQRGLRRQTYPPPAGQYLYFCTCTLLVNN